MKYPRTPHLPWSPGGTNDDKRLTNADMLIGQEIVITEKLDGGNTCLHNGTTYARSHTEPATHPTFNWIKGVHAPKTVGNKNQFFYGENMYGIHSIEYDNLEDYFYLFGVYDHRASFLSWPETEDLARVYGFKTVPVRWRGTLRYPTELHKKLIDLMAEGSVLGDTCEGFVVRKVGLIGYEWSYFGSVAKYVRADHVQTDQHWSKNWRKAELNA